MRTPPLLALAACLLTYACTPDPEAPPNDLISTADTLCATTAQAALSHAEDPRVMAIRCAAPTTMTPGTYFVGALLDATNVAAENDETNHANPTFLTMPTIQVL